MKGYKTLCNRFVAFALALMMIIPSGASIPVAYAAGNNIAESTTEAETNVTVTTNQEDPPGDETEPEEDPEEIIPIAEETTEAAGEDDNIEITGWKEYEEEGPGRKARFGRFAMNSGERLGVCAPLGGTKSHGAVNSLRIKAERASGQEEEMVSFCCTYGANYKENARYTLGTYSDFQNPDKEFYLNKNQATTIEWAIAYYVKATERQMDDYVITQIIIWYIINHPKQSLDTIIKYGWIRGYLPEAAYKSGIGQSRFLTALRNITSLYKKINSLPDAYDEDGNLNPLYWEWTQFGYPDKCSYEYEAKYTDPETKKEYTKKFTLSKWVVGEWWLSDSDENQNMVAWHLIDKKPKIKGGGDDGGGGGGDTHTEEPFPIELKIPYISNFYIEKEAITEYFVDITKESIITNELLKDIQFLVVESEAEGEHNKQLEYDVLTGTYAEYGTDYEEATNKEDSFGECTTEHEIIPYPDDDIEPSGGQHQTTLTTDENGHASTRFLHQHTFREYYSQCFNGDNEPIDYETYQADWQTAMDTLNSFVDSEQMQDAQAEAKIAAAEEGAPTPEEQAADKKITVTYKGEKVEMTKEEVQELYDSQQNVYTQTEEEATQKVDEMYNEYISRTYTYTVTELDTYTRAAASDSNGKHLDELSLPKEGYRKDVSDTTTIGPYSEVLGNGQTMNVGGRNDADPNSDEFNVTDEPWQNQFFFNKTDLETGNQILYDTRFDIYEYYQYKSTITKSALQIRPYIYVKQLEARMQRAINPKTIKEGKIKVKNAQGAEVFSSELNVEDLQVDFQGGEQYLLSFLPEETGVYTVEIEITIDLSLDPDQCQTSVFQDARLTEVPGKPNTYVLENMTRHVLEITEQEVGDDGRITGVYHTADGITIEYVVPDDYVGPDDPGFEDWTPSEDHKAYDEYKLTYPDGTTKTLRSDINKAGINTMYEFGGLDEDGYAESTGKAYRTFVYFDYEPTGYTYVKGEDGSYTVYYEGGMEDGSDVVGHDESGDPIYTVTRYVGAGLGNGTYTQTGELRVSAAASGSNGIDRNVNTDLNDYTTWGQDNYEIVRVTPEIAEQMGWSHKTIGMYTVHRKQALDAYTGTTFSSATDHATKQQFGYQEYGTLYYTQANLGHFAVVETTAPANGSKTGYLGNFEDRDYSYLDEASGETGYDKQSSELGQKNFEGNPKETDDSISKKKYVHYIHLCVDTNQYATEQLTDGYTHYDDTYYDNFVEEVQGDDGKMYPTHDGYDAKFYDQSSLVATIALEQYDLPEDRVQDVLNEFWDTEFSSRLKDFTGINVVRESGKTDTWFALSQKAQEDILHHYVGTVLNNGSYDTHNSEKSNLHYDGTYTDTNVNYNSYTEEADKLNERSGFNDNDFLQMGDVTYDNGTQEKDARYNHTESDVSKESLYSFIDEREYGYIRFSKYDKDAERYVKGDQDAAYESGTDHADSRLDGAVYSLYVDETNSFNVKYLEGTLDGVLIWAQPLNTGGYRIIKDADTSDAGFTDKGNNQYTDYPKAAYYSATKQLKLDFDNKGSQTISVTEKEATYHGIQHPDGLYGGKKHNGFFAVLEEQQVFIDLNNDGYSDTWTLQNVTLYGGAKVASAPIRDGELYFDGLYLGDYYMVEEIRDVVCMFSTNNDDEEVSEIRWLSFAPGYEADVDKSGNPTKYYVKFPYQGGNQGEVFEAEQDYVHKNTGQVSNQQVIKAGVQFQKTSSSESSESENTNYRNLEGAGFTVYLISELSKIKDGTIKPMFTELEGHKLVESNDLVKHLDEAGNFLGYEFTKEYMASHDMSAFFGDKYQDGYNLDQDVNRILYVKDRGYYWIQDIKDAYVDENYSGSEPKWDFSQEEAAIARMYEEDASYVDEMNRGWEYKANHLNDGSPCEWYGVNGLSEGWVPTGKKNEYRLSEVFTNHNGHIRIGDIPWGAYVMVETTIPTDKFSVDPFFFTVSDSSPSENKAKNLVLDDASFLASLVLVKRDAQSGQDVLQQNVSYRIYDYTNERYITKFILGKNGALSMVAQSVFTTDEEGRINAVASLERGRYRIEEIQAPEGYHNAYWDYGNSTVGELLGGLGKDKGVATFDNMLQKYFGTEDLGAVDFDVTTDRLYKSSGITSSDNLDYIYIGEDYYNSEVRGKLTIRKTGEVLVGYQDTEDIEYADEYTGKGDKNFNGSKSMMKDRDIFQSLKNYYDLGRDDITYRDVDFDVTVTEITPVKYFAQDRNGMYLAAIYEKDGKLFTLNDGAVYQDGCYVVINEDRDERIFYPGATVNEADNLFVYTTDNGETWLKALKQADAKEDIYLNEKGEVITDEEALKTIKPGAEITTLDQKNICYPREIVTKITAADNYLMIVYPETTDTYEQTVLKEVENYYIYRLQGDPVSDSYLVHDDGGELTTNDHGTLTKKSDGKYTLHYSEAVYDPDIDYQYTLKLSDGTEIPVKMVTGEAFITQDGLLVKRQQGGGYRIENADGTWTFDADATVTLAEDNSGTTWDFVYEERPLAGATYEIRAAEDIKTQDGGDNYWFRKGDLVATVTTGNNGEYIRFAPAYNKGGQYNSTFYYGSDGTQSTSLTKSNTYENKDFTTTGKIVNKWIESRMTPMDQAIFGKPAFTDETIYPNTYYREETKRFFRRVVRQNPSKPATVTDYMSRLETEAGTNSEGFQTVMELDDNNQKGFLTVTKETVNYPNGKLVENGDYFLLRGNASRYDQITRKTVRGGDVEIEVEQSRDLFQITESKVTPFTAGDFVRKTADGYRIEHYEPMQAGKNVGSTVVSCNDLGFATVRTYASATLVENEDGTFTLYDSEANELLTMKGGLYVTEFGGIVTENGSGYDVTYTVTEEYFENAYVKPSLTPALATVTVKDDVWEMRWNGAENRFETVNDSYIAFSDDYSTLSVTVQGKTNTYEAFDVMIEYDLHFAQKENIVEVEKDGTVGEVSIYLPLGKYTVKETKTPYGFVINETPQNVEFTYVDQIKEVVFNTDNDSINKTQHQMNIWESKNLSWFVGGLNTIGEKLNDIFNVNFFTWGTYGDAEEPYYTDAQGFINFFDLRVRAWSTENPPEKPDGGPHKTEVTPGNGVGVQVGEQITYEISYINNTDETADIIIRDPLDRGNTFVSADKGGEYDAMTHTVYWTIEDVPARDTGKVTLVVQVNEKAVEIVENTAYVKVGNSHEQKTETVENPLDPDGEPHKTEVTPGDGKVVKVGDRITYEITYKNNTEQTADIKIRDPLDPGNSFISATDDGTYDAANHTVNWIINDVPSGGTGKVRLVCEVNNNAKKIVYNTAYVTVGNEAEQQTETVENPLIPEGGPHKTEVTPGDGQLVKVGDHITYVIEYTNYEDTAADVIIRDPLDEGNTFISADNDGVYDPLTHSVKWMILNVPAGATGKVTLVTQVNEKAVVRVENTSYVKVGQNPEQQTETVENPLEPDGDPHKTEVTPGDGKGVRVGDQIAYEITYTNYEDTAADVFIRDPLDQGNTFLSATKGGVYDAATHTVNWTIKNVPAGESGSVMLYVEVNNKAKKEVLNTAFVRVGNNAEQQTETVENPLEPEGGPHKYEKTPGDGKMVTVGQEITYVITYKNYENEIANVIIRDPLDIGNTFVSANYGGAYDADTHTVTWDIRNVAPGATGSVELVVRVNEKAGFEVENTAFVRVGNNHEQQTEVVENPLIPEGGPHKTEVTPGDGQEVNVGDEITYEISYTNNTEETADIVIRDPLDKGNTFKEASDGGKYDADTHTVTWTIKGVAPKGTGKVTLKVTVNDKAVVEVENTAYVRVGNNSEQQTETEENPLEPDGEPHKTEPDPGDGEMVKVGDRITYEITYQNYTQDTADIVIRDPLDKGNTYLDSSDGGIYNKLTHTVTWTIKNVPAGYVGKVRLYVQVNHAAGSRVVNTAYVQVGNNAEQQTETVENPLEPEGGPHKTEVKPGDGELVKVGDKITYEISYVNDTDQEATIIIRDPLDVGNTFVNCSKDGVYDKDTHTVTWTLEHIDPGETGKVKLVVRVNEDAVSRVDNTAYVQVGNNPEQQTETVENPVEPDGGPHKYEIDPGNHVPVKVGDHITYEITYTNYTDKTADIVIRDPLDVGNTFISADKDGVYDETDHTVRWTIKDVPAGASGKVTLVVQVNANAMYQVENTAYVKVGNHHEQQTETVDNPLEDEERHPEPEEHQKYLGVGVYKTDVETKAPLAGAKFGLYTRNDIYNADGKLLVAAGTLLATATTDKNGFANFDVDIALLSKYMDGELTDEELVYTKEVTYHFLSVKDLGGNRYQVKVEGADDLILTKDPETGKYKTKDGLDASLNMKDKTVTYKVKVSIDGNTAKNTGAYYIKELTPPEGYLYDDTIYDVTFEYQDDTTLYIPVYAKHANQPTKVTLDKMDMTGTKNVPGAKVSVYRIKNIHDTNSEGFINHSDENLELLDSWTTDDTGHEVKGLWLSNTEWPRIPNEEDREVIYLWREEVPAKGYTTAQDIEFKLLQYQGPDGWVDQKTGKPYGYDVLVRTVSCDQSFVSGIITTPLEHANSWHYNHTAEESNWDYEKELSAKAEIRWYLVNKTLVVEFEDDMNPETAMKVLQERDFAQYEIEKVYLDFRGENKFEVDFFKEKQVEERPADSYITYRQMWYAIEDLRISMYDDTTKLQFTKQDIVTGEDVVGAQLRIIDPETGEVIDSWTTEADEDGNIIDHFIENVFEVNKEYLLEETLAPTEDGYVKSNSVKFRVLDDGRIQQVVMQDDFTKLQVSKADTVTGEEVEGATLELWKADSSGNKLEKVDEWTTGEDGYDENGKPKRHIIDYLEPGDYVLVETKVPDGYLQSEDVHFVLTETGVLQKAVMYDDSVALYLYKYRTGTKSFVAGATIRIYSVPEKYIAYMTDNAIIKMTGRLANSEDLKDFTQNTEGISTLDLQKHLVKASLSDVRYKEGWTTYSGDLTLGFSIPKTVMETLGREQSTLSQPDAPETPEPGKMAGVPFTMTLPGNITVPDDLLDHDYSVESNDRKVFSYRFSKKDTSYTVSVTFEPDYVDQFHSDCYNVILTVPVGINETITDNTPKDFTVTFSETISQTVKAEEITEDKGHLTVDLKEIELTEEDFVKEVISQNEKTRVGGLKPKKWYIAIETKAPSNYIIDTNPQAFYLEESAEEQALYFYNKPETPPPPPPETTTQPQIETTTQPPTTETTTEPPTTTTTTTETTTTPPPTTEPTTPPPDTTVTVVTPTGDLGTILFIVLVAAIVGSAVTLMIVAEKKRKKDQKNEGTDKFNL